MRSFSKYRFLLCLLLVLGYLSTPRIARAEPDVACIGNGISAYANDVLNGLGSLNHVKLLTPVFDLSNPANLTLYNMFSGSVDMGRFYATAANAYHHTNAPLTITDQVRSILNAGASRVVLTETGWYPSNGSSDIYANVNSDLNSAFSTGRLEAALLFNVFGDNPQFTRHTIYPPNTVSEVCGSNCSKMGANSASFYATASLYNNASSAELKYTLEIARASDLSSAISGIKAALGRGMTPIVRIGVGRDGGGFEEPGVLAGFIRSIDAQVSDTVMVIVGPNEPLLECWATPNCAGCGSVANPGQPGPRTIVGRVTSARLTLNENGSEMSNQPVEGATICGYHGIHKYGKEEVGTGIYGFYGVAVTDEKGAFELQSVYSPGNHYSKGSIVDADIIVVYTGKDYQDALIIPMASTMSDLKIEEYNMNLYGDLDLTRTLIPLDNLQTDSPTTVTPANFSGIAGYTAATDARCPEEAFYVSRDVAERTSCEVPVGQKEMGKVAAPEQVKNYIDLTFNGDDQYFLQKIKNNGEDYTPLDEMKQYNVPTSGLSSKEALPEGRFSTRAVLMATEEFRAVASKVFWGKDISSQPRNEDESANAEMSTCEQIKEYLSGADSLKPRGLGLHLASPSYYTDPEVDTLDVNSMYFWYQYNMAARELPYCWASDNTVIKFGEVEPPENWKRPGDTKTYLLDNKYFDQRFAFMTEGNEIENVVYVDPQTTSYKVPDDVSPDDWHGNLYVKSFIYREDPLFNKEQARVGVMFDPDSDVPSNMIDNGGRGWRIKMWSEIPPFTSGSQMTDAASATQYLLDGAVPPTDYISPPIYVNDRAVAQKASNIADINTDLKNFGYSQTRYRIGVQDLLCTFSDLDGDRISPISSGYRFEVREVQRDENNTALVDMDGWAGGYYDLKPSNATDSTIRENSDTLFGYQISPLTTFIDWINRIWSFFETFGENYTESNNCTRTINEVEVTECGGIIQTLFDPYGVCEMRRVPNTHDVICQPEEAGVDGCICPTDTNGDLTCSRSVTVIETKYYRYDYSEYSCTSADLEVQDFTIVNDTNIKSRNSMVGINYFTGLLSSPSVAEPKVQTQRMDARDVYATNSTIKEGETTPQGEGVFSETGQSADVVILGKLVGDPRF